MIEQFFRDLYDEHLNRKLDRIKKSRKRKYVEVDISKVKDHRYGNHDDNILIRYLVDPTPEVCKLFYNSIKDRNGYIGSKRYAANYLRKLSDLYDSIKKNGYDPKSEIDADEKKGKYIVWRGRRRLACLKALGHKKVKLCLFPSVRK